MYSLEFGGIQTVKFAAVVVVKAIAAKRASSAAPSLAVRACGEAMIETEV